MAIVSYKTLIENAHDSVSLCLGCRSSWLDFLKKIVFINNILIFLTFKNIQIFGYILGKFSFYLGFFFLIKKKKKVIFVYDLRRDNFYFLFEKCILYFGDKISIYLFITITSYLNILCYQVQAYIQTECIEAALV